jgi:hypothetical protein
VYARAVLSLVLFAALAAASVAAPAAWWPVPDGWRGEAFPLPPPFAPALAHQGSLEVRFPPGFAKTEDPRFWTYAFVWSVKAPEGVRPRTLAEDLKMYYDGLVTTYGNPDPSAPFTGTEVELENSCGGILAEVRTHDPFFTHAPLTLKLRIYEVPSALAGHRAFLFLATPRPYDPVVQQTLWTAETAFQR